MAKVMNLKDYLMEVEANTDIRFSNDILKMNLKYLFTDQTAVLDGNHIRLSELSKVDMKHVDMEYVNTKDVIVRKAMIYNYEYEPELQEKYSHIYVYINPEELKQWINQL